jgi:acyl-coenzyme A synthetase/AMP-(fatty) acid ligase
VAARSLRKYGSFSRALEFSCITDTSLLGVAAGLRCTLANSAYTSHELAYQYQDSRAKLVLTAEEGLSTVRAMFAELGLSKVEAEKRIVVLGSDLRWAGGPAATLSPDAVGLLSLDDLLVRGTMDKEETFEGAAANETVYLCYSSGTTGKPKVNRIPRLCAVAHMN